MMWAGCIGNHDYMARGYSRTTNEFFKYANYYPNNGYDDEWGVCYHFRYGNVLFVMLNSESMRSEEGLLKAQQWVERVVSDERGSDNPPRYVVVCEHYQWFFGGNGATSQFERWHKVFEYLLTTNSPPHTTQVLCSSSTPDCLRHADLHLLEQKR